MIEKNDKLTIKDLNDDRAEQALAEWLSVPIDVAAWRAALGLEQTDPLVVDPLSIKVTKIVVPGIKRASGRVLAECGPPTGKLKKTTGAAHEIEF